MTLIYLAFTIFDVVTNGCLCAESERFSRVSRTGVSKLPLERLISQRGITLAFIIARIRIAFRSASRDGFAFTRELAA